MRNLVARGKTTVTCWDTGEKWEVEHMPRDPDADYTLADKWLFDTIKPRSFDDQMAILRGACNDA